MRGLHDLLRERPSFLLVLLGRSSISIAFPHYSVHVSRLIGQDTECFVVGSGSPGLCCIQLQRTSQDVGDGRVVDVL
jgi:hypothetical protein